MDGNSLPVTSARENEDGFWNVPHLSLQIPFLLHLREHLSFPHHSLPFLLMYYQQFKHKHYSITPRGSPRKTLNCSFRLQYFHWMHHKEQINFVSEYYSYPALLQAPQLFGHISSTLLRSTQEAQGLARRSTKHKLSQESRDGIHCGECVRTATRNILLI